MPSVLVLSLFLIIWPTHFHAHLLNSFRRILSFFEIAAVIILYKGSNLCNKILKRFASSIAIGAFYLAAATSVNSEPTLATPCQFESVVSDVCVLAEYTVPTATVSYCAIATPVFDLRPSPASRRPPPLFRSSMRHTTADDAVPVVCRSRISFTYFRCTLMKYVKGLKIAAAA